MRALLVLLLTSPALALAQGYAPRVPASGGLTAAQAVAAVEDAGVLPAANRDLYANSVVLTGYSADGGTGGYATTCNGPRCCYKTAEGSSADVCAENNGVDFGALAQVTLPTTYVAAIASRPGNDLFIYNDPGKWTYFFKTSDTSGCASGTEGGIKARSTDHRGVYCDGTTVQQIGFTLSNTASVDFASMATNTDDTKTMTITGAATTDAVTCSPVGGDPESGLVHNYDRVTATDTVTLSRHNSKVLPLDPAAINYKCVIVR